MRARSTGLILAGTTVAAAGAWALIRGGRSAGHPARQDQGTYPPLDVPKTFAPDIWIVDSGPISAMGLTLPVRMTVLRLANGELILHSPTRFSAELAEALEGLGRVRHLVAPNVAHWTFLADWQRAYPDAITWGAPGLRDRAQVRAAGLRIDADLNDTAPADWADVIDQGVVAGAGGFNEMWFFHRPTRTLVLVDLIENLEADRMPPLTRLLMRAAAATRGTTARYLRVPVRLGGSQAKRAVQRVVALAPERVIFAHGRVFDSYGAARLERAFAWLT